jgi:hypothetical protein
MLIWTLVVGFAAASESYSLAEYCRNYKFATCQ